jgi:hypothetical protein
LNATYAYARVIIRTQIARSESKKRAPHIETFVVFVESTLEQLFVHLVISLEQIYICCKSEEWRKLSRGQIFPSHAMRCVRNRASHTRAEGEAAPRAHTLTLAT